MDGAYVVQTVGVLSFVDRPFRSTTVAYDDSVPHYIVYNADTRVLLMYPNVSVLEDDDVADPGAFSQRLRGAPYYLHVTPHVSHVRQVFVRLSDAARLGLPHACGRAVAKLAAAEHAAGKYKRG